MRKLVSVAIAFAMVFSSYAMAKDAAAAGPRPLRGRVTAVLKDNASSKIVSITISSHANVKGDPDIVRVFYVDENTKVTKQEGATGSATPTIADVTVGSDVNVTLGDEGKAALAIEIRAPHKKALAASK